MPFQPEIIKTDQYRVREEPFYQPAGDEILQVEFSFRNTVEAAADRGEAGGGSSYCITIDEEARDYLPHLYVPAAFTLVSEVRKLPLKVLDIYRRLTT